MTRYKHAAKIAFLWREFHGKINKMLKIAENMDLNQKKSFI